MRIKFGFIVLVTTAIGLTGCATPMPVGVAFTDNTFPLGVTSNSGMPTKKGMAECKSYLALISTGDCSIDTAMKNGGITKVQYVDWKANNILGIIGTYQVVVQGE